MCGAWIELYVNSSIKKTTWIYRLCSNLFGNIFLPCLGFISCFVCRFYFGIWCDMFEAHQTYFATLLVCLLDIHFFCINPTVWFIYLVYLIYPTYSPSIFCIASILSLSYLLSLAHVRMTNKWKHTKTLLSLSCINSYGYNYPYLKLAFGSHVSMWVCLSNNWHSSTPGPMHRPLPQACQGGSAMTKRIGAFAWWRRKTTESE